MNLEATPSPEQLTQIASPEQLASAREARGWSRSDVAAKLGMMPRQIDAIEQGRWEALPGNAFVRGAIRAYGKALQLDVAPLLAALGAQTSAPELRPSSSLDSPLPRHGALGFDNGGSGSRIVWIVLGVIGVIAIAMYFGRGADLGQVLEPGRSGNAPGRAVDVLPVAPGTSGGGDASDPLRGSSPAGSGAAPATTPAPSAIPRPAGSAAAPASAAGAGAPAGVGGSDGSAASGIASGTASGTAAGGASTAAPAGNASAAPSAATATPSSGAAAPGASDASSAAERSGAASGTAAPAGNADAASAGAPPADPASVVLRFERESWVDVRDANGKVLLMGTQPANSMREVSGQKPYSLTIGNATFVRVEHGGRNVDLGAVTQKGVARVRIE